MVPLISIIVPVYNAESYLSRCLESIINQTYQNLEIIIVDDGSTDQCGEICDAYARKDNRIQVIHQRNSGAVNARNRALTQVHGVYISFVDSDDYIELDMYEEMLLLIEKDKLDIVFCDVMDENCEIFNSQFDNDPIIIIKNILKQIIGCVLWNKLYRFKFWKDCDIQVDEQCDMMEDRYMIIQLLYNRPKVGYLNQVKYHYIATPNSITSTTEIGMKALPNIKHIYNYISSKSDSNIFKMELSHFIMYWKFNILNSDAKLAQSLWPESHRSIKNYPISLPNSLIYWLIFNFSYIGRVIWAFYHKLKH